MAPFLPPEWGFYSIDGVRIGRSKISARIDRREELVEIRIRREGADIDARVGVPVPMLLDSPTVEVDGRSVEATVKLQNKKYTQIQAWLPLTSAEARHVSIRLSSSR